MDKIKILYIEDDAGQRKQFAEQMAARGFKVTSRASGEAGLYSFKKSQVDAVLCDLNMPKMNGLEVLKKIKKIDEDVPVIILTAHGSVDMAVKALKEGAYDFVLKPPEINKISTTIHNGFGANYLAGFIFRPSRVSIQIWNKYSFTLFDAFHQVGRKFKFFRLYPV